MSFKIHILNKYVAIFAKCVPHDCITFNHKIADSKSQLKETVIIHIFISTHIGKSLCNEVCGKMCITFIPYNMKIMIQV